MDKPEPVLFIALREHARLVDTIDPESDSYGRILDFLDQCSDEQLIAIYEAHIKWFSFLALSRLIGRV